MDNVRFMQDLQTQVPFGMSLDPTIFSMNVHELQQLQDLADELKLPITFQFAAVANDYYHNEDLEQVLNIDAQGRRTLIHFLQQRIAEASLFDALAYYYQEVVARAQGATTRSLPCPFADQGLLLNPDGSLQYCHNSQIIGNALASGSGELYYGEQNLAYRRQVRQDRCPNCQMSCLFFVSLRKEVFPYLGFLWKRFLGRPRFPGQVQTAEVHSAPPGGS